MKLLKLPQDQEILNKVVGSAEYASLLVPNPREAWIEHVVELARQMKPAAVIGTPYLMPVLLEKLSGSGVDALCNVGMLTGLESICAHREHMMDHMLELGVRRIDLGMERGWIEDKNYKAISAELKKIGEKLHALGGTLGATLELASLSDDMKKTLADVAIDSGVDYIRLCSGLEQLSGVNGGRATYYEICFMKEHVGDKVKLKAGGGWDYSYAEDAYEQIQCGADRVDVGETFMEQLINMGFRR